MSRPNRSTGIKGIYFNPKRKQFIAYRLEDGVRRDLYTGPSIEKAKVALATPLPPPLPPRISLESHMRQWRRA
jgi:hypothetical protein